MMAMILVMVVMKLVRSINGSCIIMIFSCSVPGLAQKECQLEACVEAMEEWTVASIVLAAVLGLLCLCCQLMCCCVCTQVAVQEEDMTKDDRVNSWCNHADKPKSEQPRIDPGPLTTSLTSPSKLTCASPVERHQKEKECGRFESSPGIRSGSATGSLDESEGGD